MRKLLKVSAAALLLGATAAPICRAAAPTQAAAARQARVARLTQFLLERGCTPSALSCADETEMRVYGEEGFRIVCAHNYRVLYDLAVFTVSAADPYRIERVPGRGYALIDKEYGPLDGSELIDARSRLINIQRGNDAVRAVGATRLP